MPTKVLIGEGRWVREQNHGNYLAAFRPIGATADTDQGEF